MNNDEQARLAEFSSSLGLKFNNPELFKNSLIHRSYLNEVSDKSINNNERLEFLGDAVLELIVTEFLFEKYPDKAEGELTSFRAATVKTDSLAETALTMGIGEYIFMSRGEEITGGRKRPYILANTFEAILGSVYIDQGFEAARQLVTRFLLPKIDKIVSERLDIDSKSKLQEMCQDEFNITPVYDLISAVGPDHSKVFTMGLKVDKKIIARGKGKNKQEAEQNAASEAIRNWDSILHDFFNR